MGVPIGKVGELRKVAVDGGWEGDTLERVVERVHDSKGSVV